MKEHPDFYTDFMQQILGVSGSDTNKVTLDVSKFFIRGYSSMYQSLSKQYGDVNWLQKDIQKAFQYVKYYFPDYKTSKIILFLGPLDAPGVALTRIRYCSWLASIWRKGFSCIPKHGSAATFPAYISRRFESQYIVVNCMKAVIEDIYPDRSGAKGLVEQMIEKGKQWWLLDKFLPATPDSLKTGFTKQQLRLV